MLLFVLLVCVSAKQPTIDEYLGRKNSTTCVFTKDICDKCINTIATQKDYCDAPTDAEQKCICSTFRGQWRIFFEDVEDTIRSQSNACSFICTNGTVPFGANETTVAATKKMSFNGAMTNTLVGVLALLIALL
ncbi:hypothetical protein EIN_505130 [Entamoeba invadens IP1]|uniref:Uncharacterized protein n=1 Tax=Entamoeba invadens IP1 TaxID=370355 RepID=A0A0A1U7C5_ENTIV|nr:hypothetical protein EIN_505130 [Entamoeba invadens IP1]ELP90307.1 hypothetical protein EIN_505130 [Entamoeba invadens IP1]|eukprot:XP_004257078.1 hypothetical protein EIN_505130 [Entamoeba invadens IP1]